MADIFDEVGEDLRREQLKKLWQRHGWLILTLAALIVVGVGGWRAYEAWEASRAAEASQKYAAALATAETDPKATADALLAFAVDAPEGYATLARFRAASEQAKAGDAEGALKSFQILVDDASLSADLRDLARVRAAFLAVDSEDLAAIKARVAPLATDGNPWRHAAYEVTALAAIKAGDWAEARANVDKLVNDPTTPPDVSSRAQIMAAVITAEKGLPEAAAPATGS